MEIVKRTAILMILVLLTVGPGQSAEEPEKRISNTHTANCLVKIACDPAILPPDSRAVDYLMHSSAVAEKAAHEILDVPPEEIQDFIQIQLEAVSLSDSATTLTTTTGSDSPQSGLRPDADESVMEYMMMEMEPVRSSTRATPRAGTVRRPGETAGQYEARRRAAAARARALAVDRSRTRSTTSRRVSPESSSSSADTRMLFRLQVDLDQGIRPVARELLNALVENLRNALLKSYNAYLGELNSQLKLAEHNRDKTEAQLAETTSKIEAVKVPPPIGVRLGPADVAVREQLETIVDLSHLSKAMSFEEVITELKNSVDPPLQIQPNWKDLLEMADLEPTTPAMMDPLTGIKLRKALGLLLAGVSSDIAEVGYVVDEGVIVIATEDRLPKKMVTHLYDVPALAHSATSARGLVSAIQESIEPISWFDLNDLADGTINISMGNKLAIYQTYEVHEKIFQFLRSMTIDVPPSTTLQIPPQVLLSEERDLLREKQSIEMDIARLRARQSAIEMQIVQIKHQVQTDVRPDPVIAELEQLIAMHTEQLFLMEKQAEAGRLAVNELADVKEKLTRAKIDLAKRRQQMSLPAGSARVEKYNDELADLTIELAEKTAALQIINEQLGQTEQQLTVATMIDPRVSKIRVAMRAFEIADQRVHDLSAHLANLQPPVVSILGAE
jgi:hypothetical protein